MRTVRIAAVGDLHCRRASAGRLRPLFAQMAEEADVAILCGDLTDRGRAEEAHLLVQELRGLAGIPALAVLGNHDYEAGQEADLRQIFADAGVRVLDGNTWEYRGVGFVGVKGFIGGFGTRTLQPWGEPTVKRIVAESSDEALKLESGLARLNSDVRVVILHYAPIQATVEGEPPEIFPFLGSSRLEDPLHRYPVTVVIHGHAHHGSPEGRAAGGVPVYNCSLPVLQRLDAGRPPFRSITIEVKETA